MIARRNWLLKCSILVNIVVILYICSHVMIGNSSNNLTFGNGGSASFLIQQSPSTQQQPQQTVQQEQQKSQSLTQQLQDEHELAIILHNKEVELEKKIKMQESSQVSFMHYIFQYLVKNSLNLRIYKILLLCLLFPP